MGFFLLLKSQTRIANRPNETQSQTSIIETLIIFGSRLCSLPRQKDGGQGEEEEEERQDLDPSLGENKQREGRHGEARLRVLSGASVRCHCHVTRPSDRFVRSSCETRRRNPGVGRGMGVWGEDEEEAWGPAGVDVNVARCAVAARRHAGLCTHVCSYTEEP